MTENQDELSIVDNVIKEMDESFKSPFYTNTDVRAACAVGAFVSYAIYLQEKEFKTKGLGKVVSRSFNHLDRRRLERMMAKASALMYKIESKADGRVSWKHRAFAADLLTETEWTSRPEALQIAFVHGYDSYNRVRGGWNE